MTSNQGEPFAPFLDASGGSIERHHFGMYQVDVWVPADHDADTPLLVMHDGHNIFYPEFTIHNQTWDVLKAISEKRITSKRKPIIAAVWMPQGENAFEQSRLYGLAPEDFIRSNSANWGEYELDTPLDEQKLYGNHYQDTIALKIIPFITEKFSLTLKRENTAIMGSSMGGIASLYAATRHPETYGAVLCLSTHLSPWQESMIAELVAALPDPAGLKVWTDRGTLNLDAEYELPHLRLISLLENRGYARDRGFQAHIFDGTDHNELFWARRIEYPINWWLGHLESSDWRITSDQ